jgi:hypothetical protein
VSIRVPVQGAFGGYSDSQTTDPNGKYLFNVEGIPPDTLVVATVEVDPTTGARRGSS